MEPSLNSNNYLKEKVMEVFDWLFSNCVNSLYGWG